MKIAVMAAVMLLMLQLTPSAQLAFDAASIKENKALGSGGSMRFMPGGGFNAKHIPATVLISSAYNLKGFQLAGAPDWAEDANYDVIANPAESSTRAQTLLMLQTLLAERFKLSFHREMRQMDGYSLVQARPGTFGPSLHPSAIDCEKAFATEARCAQGSITFNPAETAMQSKGVRLEGLLQVITGAVNAPVTDDTQLSGSFDIELRYSTDVASTGDLPSIFTALQEQLGLKLEKRRVSTEVFVVDRFERPTPD